MPDKEPHLMDHDLLRAADGELPGSRARRVRAHLAACSLCRARRAEIEATIADFVHVHRDTLDPQLPSAAGPRALLKSRLAIAAAQSGIASWANILQFFFPRGAVAYVSLALLTCATVSALLIHHFAPPRASISFMPGQIAALPNRTLTPGATRPISISEACSTAHEEVVRDVPTSLRQQVLHEYGIANAHAQDYEIDYLVAPGLGGTENIQNLWPEPYTAEVWNAHVKDVLEEQLHELVCAGRVDLQTAQKDIATNWIAAYKKYFHTEKPIHIQVFSSSSIPRTHQS
jgi:Putative zinc-finger